MFWPTRIASLLIAVGGCFLFELLCQKVLGSYEQRLVTLAGLYVTLAVSLNLINGITGQFSIGHAAFYQVGAYTAGFLSITYYQKAGNPGIPWLIAMALVGAAFAAIAGFIVGLPSLRLKGDYLAVVTLGFGEIIRIFVNNTPAVGGSYGLNVQPKFQSIGFVWLLAVVCVAVCRNLLKTAHGLPFLAVREDEIASSAMGVDVTKVKVFAFLIGSAFAGAAGALLAHFEGFISPATFAMDVSFIILTMVVLGGTGSITGSVLSAIFLSYLPEYLRGLKDSSGAALNFSGPVVASTLIAVAVTMAVMKKIADGHAEKRQRALQYIGALGGGAVIAVVLSIPLGQIPALAEKKATGDQLRMVIFAVALIVLMLLRPQGLFAHHEFSWAWLRKVLGREEKVAVQA
ncbi:MAG: branched-chain amino acid ABC transporter permease [Fimbriimonas sp.]